MAQLHTLVGKAATREVYLDGKLLDPKPSQKYHNHSPDGFNWGYAGSGPSQLALAVILAINGKPDGYMDFKFEVIAPLPQGQDFDISFEHGWQYSHNLASPTKIGLAVDVDAPEYLDKNGNVIRVGNTVDAPDPDDSDIYNFAFRGTVVAFRYEYAVVEDQDGDCFDIETNRLEVVSRTIY